MNQGQCTSCCPSLPTSSSFRYLTSFWPLAYCQTHKDTPPKTTIPTWGHHLFGLLNIVLIAKYYLLLSFFWCSFLQLSTSLFLWFTLVSTALILGSMKCLVTWVLVPVWWAWMQAMAPLAACPIFTICGSLNGKRWCLHVHVCIHSISFSKTASLICHNHSTVFIIFYLPVLWLLLINSFWW